MTIVTAEIRVDAPLDAAWAVLADFGRFTEWAGGPGATSELEGEGVGMIRHMDIPGVGKMAETLDVADHDTKTLGYTLVYGDPIGMAKYTARVRLEDGGDGACVAHWHGEFEAADGADDATVSEALNGSYEGMSQALGIAANQQ